VPAPTSPALADKASTEPSNGRRLGILITVGQVERSERVERLTSGRRASTEPESLFETGCPSSHPSVQPTRSLRGTQCPTEDYRPPPPRTRFHAFASPVHFRATRAIARAGPAGVSSEDLGRALGIPGETLEGMLRAMVTAGQVVMVRANGRLVYRAAG
jgi:hypothetical protein